MKKLLALFVAVTALSAVSFAQQKPKPAPKEISCAVMKNDMVEIKEATKAKRFADYNGRRYFFCCPSCVKAFKKNPAKYAKAPSIPTPKK